jgi:hypothetical protein
MKTIFWLLVLLGSAPGALLVLFTFSSFSGGSAMVAKIAPHLAPYDEDYKRAYFIQLGSFQINLAPRVVRRCVFPTTLIALGMILYITGVYLFFKSRNPPV